MVCWLVVRYGGPERGPCSHTPCTNAQGPARGQALQGPGWESPARPSLMRPGLRTQYALQHRHCVALPLWMCDVWWGLMEPDGTRRRARGQRRASGARPPHWPHGTPMPWCSLPISPSSTQPRTQQGSRRAVAASRSAAPVQQRGLPLLLAVRGAPSAAPRSQQRHRPGRGSTYSYACRTQSVPTPQVPLAYHRISHHTALCVPSTLVFMRHALHCTALMPSIACQPHDALTAAWL